MTSFITSYVRLFEPQNKDKNAFVVKQVEIPLIQRDYAQGRENPDVNEIRSDFLDVLVGAVTERDPVGLDFIYGDLRGGTLRPLDGQQRLTTLFLLHWYIAFRTGRLSPALRWTRFTYATRASAELFCERIVANPPPAGIESPSIWIQDQPWYLHVWRYDPTIQAMLVMIDALDQRLEQAGMEAAWARLTSESDPAISFHVLPIEEIGAGDELYIKMNSRGKPLTPFENFKARFEKALEGSPRLSDFAQRVDGAWSEVFWRYRGSDDIVDDEFVRYISFVTEVAEWQNGKVEPGRLEARAEAAFGSARPNGSDNLDFLFGALDAWVETDVEKVFTELITTDANSEDGAVRFFGIRQVDHFRACCDTYSLGRQRTFGWAETLTLYAFLIHRINQTEDFPRRLRVLRNLLEASGNELRLENMPALIRAVNSLVLCNFLDEALADLSTFNEAQIEDERDKASFLKEHPDLTQVLLELEDHRLLRGSLVAFALDADRLPARAACFKLLMAEEGLWPALTAALLATGDYSRHPNPRSFKFGSPENDRWWRELLTGTKRSSLFATSRVLGELLDAVSHSDGDPADTLLEIREEWLARQDGFDWRYYFVKHDAMREGKSGIYFAEGGIMGFRLCMLDKTQLNSWYRDPYLLAVWRVSGLKDAVRDPWFMGYETGTRWMTLRKSETRICSVDTGFRLQPPPDANHLEAFEAVREALSIGEDYVLTVTQIATDGRTLDAEDRIQLGAKLLTELVAAGL